MPASLETRSVNFCPESDGKLKRLKGKTGVTPNLLCRIGFCMSLEEEGGAPVPSHYPAGKRDIKRHTLTGEYDDLFVALLRQRLLNDGLVDSMEEQFHAHMNRGVQLLAARSETLPELLQAHRV